MTFCLDGSISVERAFATVVADELGAGPYFFVFASFVRRFFSFFTASRL